MLQDDEKPHPDDHRLLARRLNLFHIEPESPGMIYWHGPGWRIYRQIEDFIRARMGRAGYEEVRSPQLLPESLWQRSGHLEKFGEMMFRIERGEKQALALKPMSCPCHLQIFSERNRSWRDLPMRICEFGQVHRDEPSGSLHGLMRSRAFEQDDAHVICRPEQVEDEVERFVKLLKEVYAAFGFEEIEVALSLRPESRAGSDADWDDAEAHLERAARRAGLDPQLLPGEGAFYGPKLEFALKDKAGRSWQCGTIQLDMVLPRRLEASYVGEDGARHAPIMLHHAVLGSIGRFIGILLEQHGGRLPFWLAPVQIAVLPIADAQHAAAQDAVDVLRSAGYRPKLMAQSESLSRRIVQARDELIPARIVIGAREVEKREVMLRLDGEERPVPIEALAEALAGAAG